MPAAYLIALSTMLDSACAMSSRLPVMVVGSIAPAASETPPSSATGS